MGGQTLSRPGGLGRANLSGTWLKDRSASEMDCYSRQLDLFDLGGIQKRAALGLMKGLEIAHTNEGFTANFLMAKLPWFKQREEYRLGQEVAMSRRDRREGDQIAVMQETPEGLQVDIKWDDPKAGSVQEIYSCPAEGVLQVKSVTRVGKKQETCTQIYRRAG